MENELVRYEIGVKKGYENGKKGYSKQKKKKKIDRRKKNMRAEIYMSHKK